jgi:hypothetical protein
VLSLRSELKQTSALGEYGARAIHREMAARGWQPLPHVRTIGRILERRGLWTGVGESVVCRRLLAGICRRSLPSRRNWTNLILWKD